MREANQIARKRQDVHVTAADLLQVPKGPITENGLRQNVNIGIGYLEAWLRGIGCVPLYNLMEDAATAEICRAQLWQWLRFDAELADGHRFTRDLFDRLFDTEVACLADVPNIQEGAALFRHMVTAEDFEEFLTLPAYELLD
jgi:malate synthase